MKCWKKYWTNIKNLIQKQIFEIVPFLKYWFLINNWKICKKIVYKMKDILNEYEKFDDLKKIIKKYFLWNI